MRAFQTGMGQQTYVFPQRSAPQRHVGEILSCCGSPGAGTPERLEASPQSELGALGAARESPAEPHAAPRRREAPRPGALLSERGGTQSTGGGRREEPVLAGLSVLNGGRLPVTWWRHLPLERADPALLGLPCRFWLSCRAGTPAPAELVVSLSERQPSHHGALGAAQPGEEQVLRIRFLKSFS